MNSVLPTTPDGQRGSIPAIIILPLRLFIGLIFFFAGIDKLTDPTFLDPNNANYIGTQLQNFVTYNHSPLSFLLTSIAIPNAKLFGILISLTEMLVGLLVLLGLFTRVAAAVGFLLSTTLWLTASWGQAPFYYGWDLPYMFGWLTLALAGAGPFSLDDMMHARSRTLVAVSHERRNFLISSGAMLGAIVAIAVGGGVAVTGLLTRNNSSSGSSGGGTSSPPPTSTSGGQIAPTTQPAVAAPTDTTTGSDIGPSSVPPGGATDTPIAAPTPIPANGVVIGKVSDVPSGSGLHFVDPTTQNDAWIIHLSSGDFVAYSAICTHMGCSVGYNSDQQLFICPCHGSEYNPTTGAVVRPPAPRPLSKLQIRVDETSGNIYYVSD